MTRRWLLFAALLAGLGTACGKYGPPVRVRAEPTPTAAPTSAAPGAASPAGGAEEKEKQP
jgi:hypothetical protein